MPALARWLLGSGIAATLAANVAHGLGRGFGLVRWPAQLACGAEAWKVQTPLAGPGVLAFW